MNEEYDFVLPTPLKWDEIGRTPQPFPSDVFTVLNIIFYSTIAR